MEILIPYTVKQTILHKDIKLPENPAIASTAVKASFDSKSSYIHFQHTMMYVSFTGSTGKSKHTL